MDVTGTPQRAPLGLPTHDTLTRVLLTVGRAYISTAVADAIPANGLLGVIATNVRLLRSGGLLGGFLDGLLDNRHIHCFGYKMYLYK